MLQMMSKTDDQEVRDGTDEYSLYFLIAGIAVGFATFLQVSRQSFIF
jgi:ATP-binding cassette subfamily B (MDR/TAP) protein 1